LRSLLGEKIVDRDAFGEFHQFLDPFYRQIFADSFGWFAALIIRHAGFESRSHNPSPPISASMFENFREENL
jgi:hypothetical protein